MQQNNLQNLFGFQFAISELRRTPELVLFIVGTLLFAIPDPVSQFHTQVLADLLTGGYLLISLIRVKFQLFIPQSIAIILGLIFISGIIAAGVTMGNSIYAFLLNYRYLIHLPLAYFIIGFYLYNRYGINFWILLIPALAINVILMFISVRHPFIGHTEMKYITGEGRYFIFPIGDYLVRPVALSEACSFGFAGIVIAWKSRKNIEGIILSLLSFCCVMIAIVSATRTYLFGITLVGVSYFILAQASEKIKLVALVSVAGLAVSIPTYYIYWDTDFVQNAMQRLDRFGEAEDLVRTAGRLDIWHDRISNLYEEITPISGMGMQNYRNDFDISSHNLFIDLALIGGFSYFVFMLFLFIFSIKNIVMTFFVEKLKVHIPLALASLMYIVVFFVSSPLISSKQTLATSFILFGAISGASYFRGRKMA